MLKASFGNPKLPEEEWFKSEFPDNQVNAIAVEIKDIDCGVAVKRAGWVFSEQVYGGLTLFDERTVSILIEDDKITISTRSCEDGPWEETEVSFPPSKTEERKKD